MRVTILHEEKSIFNCHSCFFAEATLCKMNIARELQECKPDSRFRSYPKYMYAICVARALLRPHSISVSDSTHIKFEAA